MCALAQAAAIIGHQTALEFDPARTSVTFTLADVLHTVRGNFKLKRGALRFDPANGNVAGEVVVDAASGESGSDARDRRMHRNILESSRYPEIIFAPDRVEGTVLPTGPSKLQVHGIFTIHGASHEMTIPVELRMGEGQATATMRFAVPYVKWGMKNPSTLLLRVSDKVDIEIQTAAEIR